MQLTPKETRAFSLHRAVEQAGGDGLRGSLESEILEEACRESGRTFTPFEFVVPWQLLNRDMTAAGSSGSNYIVGTEMNAAVDALRGYSIVGKAGATVLPNLVGNQTIPRASAEATGYWLANEATTITGSQPTLAPITLTPKTLAAIVTVSHQFRVQAQPDNFLSNHLLQVIARTLDVAALGGSGSSGQPTGLAGISGVGTQSGTTLGWAGVQTMLGQIGDGNADDDSVSWIATPAVRKLLAAREKASGSGVVWNGREMAGFPAMVSTSCPTASLFVGPWAAVAIGLWGVGPEVKVNPGSLFAQGGVQMRCMVEADIGCRHPAAFSVSTSIT